MNIFKVFLVLLIALPAFTQDKPSIGFEELLVSAEEDARIIADARKLTAIEDIPHTIFLPEGIFIEAKGIEDGNVVYAIFNDLVDIYNNSESAFWEEIQNRYDLNNARLHYVNRPTQNPQLGYYEINGGTESLTIMLMVTNWTTDGVSTLDATTGDMLNSSFIADATNLSSPKEANLAPWGQITVSDQLEDGVIEYDTSGSYLQFFAPAGGVNNAILDNVRGHNFRPNGNLVVTSASGSNADAIAEFDAGGNYLGNFIAIGAGGMDSPFDIVFRTNDCLVSTSTSDAVHRYDLNGTYLDDFATNINFAQQIFEMDNGNIAVAGFSTPSGIYIYSPTGTLLNTLSVVTGVRSVYQLPNGHLLTTSGTSLYEIDENTGAIIRTIATGLSFQYISLYDYSIVPVELKSFTASVNDNDVTLNWETASEINNSGFQIERKSTGDYEVIGFLPGFGTTTEPRSYSFTDAGLQSEHYIYRLKQIDLDGSFEYSDEIQVEVTIPDAFALEQNYPNPFNPSTKINFSLAVDSKVSLKVFDVLGQEVATLINSNLLAGSHNVDFSAANINSGVYFYRLQAGSFVETKKMVLMK
jgi:hypothetical protein